MDEFVADALAILVYFISTMIPFPPYVRSTSPAVVFIVLHLRRKPPRPVKLNSTFSRHGVYLEQIKAKNRESLFNLMRAHFPKRLEKTAPLQRLPVRLAIKETIPVTDVSAF